LGKTKDSEFDICCFSAKHAALLPLRRKRKDWLAWNQDNVFLSTIVYTFGTMILVKLLIKKEMCIKCKQEKTGVKYYLCPS
jgi:hypothetical protein